MARGRKSTKVKVITSRDRSVLVGLGHLGFSTAKQLRDATGINNRRLQRLVNSGYLKGVSYLIEGHLTKCFRLGRRGRSLCRSEERIQLYKFNPRQLYHDFKLAEFYWGLEPGVRETWQNETMMQSRFPSGELEACVDATIIIDGAEVGIEATGKTYTPDVIEQKQSFADQYLGGRIYMF